MGDVIQFKSRAVLAATGAIERGGKSLALYNKVTPLLGLYLDSDDNWILHTGAHTGGFRGYVNREGERFVMSAWCASDKRDAYRQPNIYYKSEGLAVQALTRAARWIEA